MQIVTAGRTGIIDAAAVDALSQEVRARLDGAVHLVVAYHTAHDRQAALAGTLAAAFPGAAVLGCSSCRGVITEAGLHGFTAPGLALWALSDAEGAYGVGFAEIADDPRGAAAAALDAALQDAERVGEMPDLLLVHGAPGQEEAVVQTLDTALGGQVPVLGGSAADDAFTSGWHCFAGGRAATAGLAVAALFPSGEVAHACQSGFLPAAQSGIVTAAHGRVVSTIDDQPAAAVYDAWTGGAIAAARAAGGNLLAAATLAPLGVEAGTIAGTGHRAILCYTLLQPMSVNAQGELTLLADVAAGQRLHLMRGAPAALVARGGQVALDVIAQGGPRRMVGGIMLQGAGGMLAAGEHLGELQAELRAAFAGAPHIGAFTFGEQACRVGGENRHGSLTTAILGFAA